MGNIQSAEHLSEHRSPKRYRLFARKLMDDAASTHSNIGSETNLSSSNSPIFKNIGGRTYNVAENETYLLPNDSREADRLHEQHYMIKFIFDGNYEPYIKESLEKEVGEPYIKSPEKEVRVLDIACGSATWMLEMAHEFVNIEFYGIDISPIFPSEIKPANTHFTLANVLDGIPFPDDHFDMVAMRMTIGCWNDELWPAVMTEIYRVVKPGGYVQLTEPDNTIWRIEAEKQEVWKKWNAWQINKGCDMYIGRRIHKFIHSAGFENVQRRYMSTPLNWGGPIGKLCNDTWLGLMTASAPRIASHLGYTEKEFEKECRALAEYSESVQGYVNFHVATGRKPLRVIKEAA